MTDGMLVAEFAADLQIDEYSVIMLDEAHERSISTDVGMGLLKKLLKSRPDLTVIVTSATLDSNKFSQFFHNAPILEIPGRTFPVEIIHTRCAEPDYVNMTINQIMKIHEREPPGTLVSLFCLFKYSGVSFLKAAV